MGGSWEENEPLSDFNVTPFVDVLLVLLIIFMVTAPIVNHVIQVLIKVNNQIFITSTSKPSFPLPGKCFKIQQGMIC